MGVNAPHWTAPALAPAQKLKKPSLRLGRQGLFSTFQDGGAKEARTPDLLNAIQTLYQLSYDPIPKRAANLSFLTGKSIAFLRNFAAQIRACRPANAG